MESKSKFACLRIDDDSDQEFSPVVSKSSTKGHGKIQNAHKQTGPSKLVVHAVERQRPRAKKDKTKVVDPETGFVVQDAGQNYQEEQKFKQDLRHALKESLNIAKEPVEHEEVSENKPTNPVEQVLADLPSHGEGTDDIMITLYKSKLTESIEKQFTLQQELATAQSQYEHQRTRYKKLVELFRDSELTEKAKLVQEVSQLRASETDLTAQLAAAQSQLEQARTKIRQLESSKR